jgi:hypothetical protein
MISKQWWFQVYSFPLIKRILIWFLVALLADFILVQFLDDSYLGFICFSLPLIPFLGMVSQRKPSIRANLAFHQLHIPMKQLRKDYLVNFFLDFICTSLALGSLHLLSSLFKGNINKSVSELYATIGFYQFIFYYFAVLVFAFYSLINEKDMNKKKAQFAPLNGGLFKLLKFLTYNLLVGIPVVILFVIITGLEVEAIILIFLGGGIGACMREINTRFHGVSEIISYKILFSHFVKGNLLAFGIYFICALGARYDVLNPLLSPDQRAKSFRFSGVLKPTIDIETFKVIEPKLSALSSIYSHVDFDPSILGIDYFSDQNDARRLTHFLSSGEPSKEFLLNLYNKFETHQQWKDKKFDRVVSLAFSRWPDGQKLPDRYLLAKEKSIEIQKQYDSELAEKRRRHMASE